MTSRWHGGKGSNPRPTNKPAYDSGYDAIFRNKAEAEPAPEYAPKEQTDPNTSTDISTEEQPDE